MAGVQNLPQLRRARNLRIVREAIAASDVSRPATTTGLAEVVNVLKDRFASPAARSGLDVRNLLLTVATEWDLQDDPLDRQSDTCLATLAVCLQSKSFLRRVSIAPTTQ